MKKIIFVLSIIVCFKGNILLTTDGNTKNNFENIKDFLDSTNIDEKEKKFIIDYFKQPGAGVPIWLKNQIKTKKLSKSKFIKLYNLLFQNPNQPYPQKLKIDKCGTAIASKLRQHTKINPDLPVPIFAKKFKLSLAKKNAEFCFWHHYSDIAYKIKYPYIILDSLLNNRLSRTIPFRLAHEYAHIEMGLCTARKMLCLGIINALSSYMFLSHKKCNKLTSIIGFVGSYILSIFLSKGYFQQQEEKACDLRAIELIKSDVGMEDFFRHELDAYVVFSNNDWIIAEITVIFDKPQEYTTWKEKLFSSHPSNAERIRYCKAFAKKRGYTKKSLNHLFL